VPPLFPDDIKESVRARTDIVGLISESVALRAVRGGREFIGLCPFHDDHNPSLRVYPDRQSFKCWSCNEGGDCFSFVMKRERIEFRAALEMLARRAGVELPRHNRAPGARVEDKNRQYEILAWAENELHECLLQSPAAERARRYLRERGISGESIVKFRLGYHPDNWEWLLDRARTLYLPEQLAAARLAAARDGGSGFYDYFVDRVVFPIRDTQKRPVAFGGRVLPDSRQSEGPKYWNSPESELFSKSRLLYGLDQARDAIARSQTAVVVEGYTDCIMAHQHGLANVVGTLGTALNENHVMTLKRFSRSVVLVFDGDEAGRRAAERSLARFLAFEIDLRILTLPGNTDPADFLSEHGRSAFEGLLNGAVEAWEHKFRLAVERYGLESIDARHRVLQEMLETLSEVRGRAGGLAAAWRERENIILGRLSQQLKIHERHIRERLLSLRQSGEQRQMSVEVTLPGSPLATAPKPDDTIADVYSPQATRDQKAERDLLEIMLAFPEKVPLVRQEVPPEEISHPHLRALMEICCELSDLGLPCGYEQVTSRLEDAPLKRLAAQLDLHVRHAGHSPELVEHTLGYFRRRRSQRDGPDVPAVAIDAATPGGLSDQARDRLKQLTELARRRASTTRTN
jgi:DNA primase